MSNTPMLKVLILLAAALLFLIGSFVDDPTKWWGFGFVGLSIGLIIDQLVAMTGAMKSAGGSRT